ncbi:Lsr2 family protein [Nocardioides sp. YIM 152588]|uniref:histone-like nucleoid-structuring protein Lsr2 n=1 Tax=Nocardioides sp. YIM 152588 TaxID=3158259 RepID=UPI0032E412C2
MAIRRQVEISSDLSSAPLTSDAAPVRFSLDGTHYEIDLTADEERTLRACLQPYLAAARRSGRQDNQAAGPTATAPELRAWAAANGYVLPSRGRIPDYVREAHSVSERSASVAGILDLLEPVGP